MTFLEDQDFSEIELIPDYYKGKTIFITGGSGFLGKALTEKLLHSCPGLDRVYLLLRTKRGLAPHERLAALYSQPCFDRLRNERPGLFESKVFFIAGDVGEKGLGISEEDRTLLINRTNIIFHSAASVRFDDTLQAAFNLNVRGTIEMINLAKEMTQLESFVHVSTSYSNTSRDVIHERMYPALADWRELLDICDSTDPHVLQVLTPKILGQMPNTYVFTKQLAEHVVYEQKGQIPIVIARPSIVVASLSEPIPGWVDNFNGPTGILVAGAKGVLRTIYTDPEIISDYIPVDVVIKGLVTIAWARGTKKLESSDDIPIYNTCTGGLTPITVQEIVSTGMETMKQVPLMDMFRPPRVDIERSKFVYNIKVLLYHFVPAILVDILLRILGKKPMLLKIQRRIYTANIALEYYLTRQWTFDNTNFVDLRSKIKPDDKELFFYSFEDIDAVAFYKACITTSRKFLLNETEEDLPKAKKIYRRAEMVDRALQVLFYGCLLYWFLNLDSVKKFIMDYI
ncbi:putative fatty acyl-CoA reductase CG5065 [Aricia agestis]|uniref:putative fatty acyl-CoA reductase CG5065 n=1 Tax=Aricia agestis TaxID=91739 RepID=UPI001C2062F2|nr:putative fatty acyl-CoA reductase CG5065 [Aricia agestis]